MAVRAPLDPSFFDQIGLKYEEAFAHDPSLINLVKLALDMVPKEASVLDIGCGTGKPVASMIAASGRKVLGIDNSSTMVALSRRQVPQGSFKEVSFFDFQPQPASFDAVFAIFCWLNLGYDLVPPLLKKINTWMVPGSYFFIGTITADDYGANTTRVLDSHHDYGGRHIQMRFMGEDAPALVYSKDGWVAMLQDAGFEVVQTVRALFRPPAEADCDDEMHHYIVACKSRQVSK